MHCEFCRQGLESLCPEAKLSGFTVSLVHSNTPSTSSLNTDEQVDGTFQQYAVSFVNHLSRIPDGMRLDDAAPILCAGVTVYKALKQSNAKTGNWVALRKHHIEAENCKHLPSSLFLSWCWRRSWSSCHPVRQLDGFEGHRYRCKSRVQRLRLGDPDLDVTPDRGCQKEAL